MQPIWTPPPDFKIYQLTAKGPQWRRSGLRPPLGMTPSLERVSEDLCENAPLSAEAERVRDCRQPEARMEGLLLLQPRKGLASRASKGVRQAPSSASITSQDKLAARAAFRTQCKFAGSKPLCLPPTIATNAVQTSRSSARAVRYTECSVYSTASSKLPVVVAVHIVTFMNTKVCL